MTETTTRLAVPDVSCERCKDTLEAAVGALDGVSSVDVDLPGRVVTVAHHPGRAPAERLVAAVEHQGYAVAGHGEVR
ncbi:MAG: heavy-metal-associated domain-containing protein [Thermoleophilaceae bacterium]